MDATNSWFLFRKARVIILGLSSVLSLVWAIFISIYLSQVWRNYNIPQRIMVLSLIFVKGITAVFLYLLAVVLFRIFMDAAWMSFLILAQLAVTIVFTLFSPNFPCDGFGSTNTCKRITSSIVIGCWVLSSLLVGYVICLLIMTFIPTPPPPPTLESPSSDLPSNMSDITRPPSQSSVDSITPLVSPYQSDRRWSKSSLPSALPSPNFAVIDGTSSPRENTSSIMHFQQMWLGGFYDSSGRIPSTPGNESIHSTSSVGSSNAAFVYPEYVLRGSSRRASPYPLSRQPALAPVPPAKSPRPLPLPNPFREPRSPESTYSASTSSSISSLSDLHCYGRRDYTMEKPFTIPPKRALNLTFGGPTFPPPPPYIPSPPYREDSKTDNKEISLHPNVLLNSFASPASSSQAGKLLDVPGSAHTPMSPLGVPRRENASSPAMYSIHSMNASLHAPSGSLGTLPNAPPPTAQSPYGFHRRSRTAFVAPFPQNIFDMSGYGRVSEIKRYGSVPNGMAVGREHGLPSRAGNITHIHVAPQRTPGAVHGMNRTPPVIDYGLWQKLVLDAAGQRV